MWKDLGLRVRDADGTLILPDDRRVIEVLAHAGALGLPVLIHTADPIAFFEPRRRHNERLDELAGVPDWWFGDTDRYPTFDRLLDAHAALVLACPGTTFIGAHAGCAPRTSTGSNGCWTPPRTTRSTPPGGWPSSDVSRAGSRASWPTIPARCCSAPTAIPPTTEPYRLHFRFFETADEGFAYDPGRRDPRQGRWTVSALRARPRPARSGLRAATPGGCSGSDPQAGPADLQTAVGSRPARQRQAAWRLTSTTSQNRLTTPAMASRAAR